LAFVGQLVLLRITRAVEANRLARERREVFRHFMEAVRLALDHLAESGVNRLNGAIGRGAYGEAFREDESRLRQAITRMEMLGVPESALTLARHFCDSHSEFSNRETNAAPVQRDELDAAAFQQLGTELLETLESLSSISNKFGVAAEPSWTALGPRATTERSSAPRRDCFPCKEPRPDHSSGAPRVPTS
jgi:hypothetical protein